MSTFIGYKWYYYYCHVRVFDVSEGDVDIQHAKNTWESTCEIGLNTPITSISDIYNAQDAIREKYGWACIILGYKLLRHS